MRPSLSPFENGAYGTPFRVVSVEVGGPQPSVAGKASTRSRSEGAMTRYRKKRELIILKNCAGTLPKIQRCLFVKSNVGGGVKLWLKGLTLVYKPQIIPSSA
jgi:hypothetical protein